MNNANTANVLVTVFSLIALCGIAGIIILIIRMKVNASPILGGGQQTAVPKKPILDRTVGTGRIPFVAIPEAPHEMKLEGNWPDSVRAFYPDFTKDGEILRIKSHYDRRCNTGLDRQFASATMIHRGDIVVIHCMRIDNFTELHGMREVYEEIHQHVVDVWTKNGEVLSCKRVHAHSDYVLGDLVQGLNHGGIWEGGIEPVKNVALSDDGSTVTFSKGAHESKHSTLATL